MLVFTAILQCFQEYVMATASSSATSVAPATAATAAVRCLSKGEVALLCQSLSLQAKSYERAAKAAANSVISDEYAKQAAVCSNLINELRSGSLSF